MKIKTQRKDKRKEKEQYVKIMEIFIYDDTLKNCKSVKIYNFILHFTQSSEWNKISWMKQKKML